MKRLILNTLAAFSALSFSSCFTANNVTDNILLDFERSARFIDRASEMSHELRCVTCPEGQHFLTAEVELRLQNSLLNSQTRIAKAYQGLRASGLLTGKVNLTAQTQADIESNLVAAQVGLPNSQDVGAGSTAAAKLQGVIGPANTAISDILAQFKKLKLSPAGATFDISKAQVKRAQQQLDHYVALHLIPAKDEQQAEVSK